MRINIRITLITILFLSILLTTSTAQIPNPTYTPTPGDEYAEEHNEISPPMCPDGRVSTVWGFMTLKKGNDVGVIYKCPE